MILIFLHIQRCILVIRSTLYYVHLCPFQWIRCYTMCTRCNVILFSDKKLNFFYSCKSNSQEIRDCMAATPKVKRQGNWSCKLKWRLLAGSQQQQHVLCFGPSSRHSRQMIWLNIITFIQNNSQSNHYTTCVPSRMP